MSLATCKTTILFDNLLVVTQTLSCDFSSNDSIDLVYNIMLANAFLMKIIDNDNIFVWWLVLNTSFSFAFLPAFDPNLIRKASQTMYCWLLLCNLPSLYLNVVFYLRISLFLLVQNFHSRVLNVTVRETSFAESSTVFFQFRF